MCSRGLNNESVAHRPAVTFVVPCLNEAETIGACVDEINACCAAAGIDAEVVVADNGSADESVNIARLAGARVVAVEQRGYGATVLGGVAAARARSVVMLDADLSYDPAESLRMLAVLEQGADLVVGSRLRGTMESGAMPPAHRVLGTPTLTRLTRLLFGGSLSDTQSGMRAFRRDVILELGLMSPGMEFASEMIVRGLLAGLDIKEVPIAFRRDGRSRPPHLRPWRDAWRHLRLLMLYSPRWTLAFPGCCLFVIGCLLGAAVVAGPLELGGVTLDLHTLVVAGLLMVMGFQAITTAIAVRVIALRDHLGQPSPWLDRVVATLSLERGLWLGAAIAALGVGLIAWQTGAWMADGMGPLPLDRTLRPVVVGATMTAIGMQTVLTSVTCAMLALPIRREHHRCSHESPAADD
jgi:hypothetical protein